MHVCLHIGDFSCMVLWCTGRQCPAGTVASALGRHFVFLLDLLVIYHLYMCCYLERESKSAMFPFAIDPWECVASVTRFLRTILVSSHQFFLTWGCDRGVYCYYYFSFLGYRLIIVCCEDSFERSHFVSKLHLYHQQYMSLSSESKYADYLMQHFKQQDMMSAASVDCDKSVRIYFVCITSCQFYRY